MIRIIIVDDDKDVVETLSMLVKENDIDVAGIGHDGLEAVELYKQLKPDIAMINLKMPKYDGNYAVYNIKKEDPKAKIILVTGFSDEEINQKDAVTILHKPFEPKDVIDTIKQVAEKS